MSSLIYRSKICDGALLQVLRDRSGATLIEFALIMPILFGVTFGIIEFAMISWAWNVGEKATEAGVRYAVESDPVNTGFTTWSALAELDMDPTDSVDLTQVAEFVVRCDNAACAVSSGAAPSGFVANGYDAAAFQAILQEVQNVFPEVTAANLFVEYRHVGLGYAGRPGPDLIPSVSVGLQNMTHDVILMEMFGFSDVLNLDSFVATLPGEDLSSTWP